jgi:YfiH family protein
MSELTVLTSPLLAEFAGVRHAFFTRQGGASEGVYASLNHGVGSNDDPGRVQENRRRAAAHFGLSAERLLTAYQIHSPDIVAAAEPWSERPQADGVVTAAPGLICGALAADCAPVLLADPKARVVGAAHAGWRGALGGVVDSAVARMVELGARPGRIVAAVGPCIGPSSYEVGLEFLQAFQAADPGSGRFFAPGEAPDKRLFDLPAFVLERLRAAGVGRCEWTGHDTFADAELFYSNRRAFKQGEPDYGRLLSAIVLT